MGIRLNNPEFCNFESISFWATARPVKFSPISGKLVQPNFRDQISLSPQISIVGGQKSGHPRLARPSILVTRDFTFVGSHVFVVCCCHICSWMSPIGHQHEFDNFKVGPVGFHTGQLSFCVRSISPLFYCASLSFHVACNLLMR